MESIISQTTAAYSLLVLLFALGFFHLLILVGIIPHSIIWAGKIKSRKQLIQLEMFSIFILLVAALIAVLNTSLVEVDVSQTSLKIANWALFGFFVLNTLGNLTAKTKFEKFGFGSLTIIMAFLALALAL
ncbi:hypothetical protein [Halocola ammonii]